MTAYNLAWNPSQSHASRDSSAQCDSLRCLSWAGPTRFALYGYELEHRRVNVPGTTDFSSRTCFGRRALASRLTRSLLRISITSWLQSRHSHQSRPGASTTMLGPSPRLHRVSIIVEREKCLAAASDREGPRLVAGISSPCSLPSGCKSSSTSVKTLSLRSCCIFRFHYTSLSIYHNHYRYRHHGQEHLLCRRPCWCCGCRWHRVLPCLSLWLKCLGNWKLYFLLGTFVHIIFLGRRVVLHMDSGIQL